VALPKSKFPRTASTETGDPYPQAGSLGIREPQEVAAVLLLFRGPAAFSLRIRRLIPGDAGFFQIVRTRVSALRESVFAELVTPADCWEDGINSCSEPNLCGHSDPEE
jgi:hypothetical protein